MENKIKILIGGGAGYIGSRLCPELISHGYEVTVVDSLWFGNYLPKKVRIIKKDLFECTAKDMEGFDQFIFLAGISNDPMAEFNPSKNFVYNAALPSYLAFEAKKAGIKRYIYASSCSVYGYTIDELYDEEAPVSCSYPYGISKLQGEKGVFQIQDKDFSVIALRQGTVCGYSPRMRFDLIVNTMYKTAITEGKVIINNPSIWRPIYHIEDCVSAYLRAIQVNINVSGVFNVASDNYTVGQIGDIVKKELEKLSAQKLQLEINNIQDFRNYKVAIDKAKTILGFLPQYGIQDIIFDLFKNRSKYKDINQDKYYNIRIFKNLNI